jgi:hypothetical protein
VHPFGPASPGTFAVSLRTGEVPQEYTARAIPWDVGTGANFAVRRAWLDRAGGYDERLGAGSPGRAGEDVDLLDRLLRLGALVRFEPRAIVYHERQPLARRLSTRSSYAHGVGAMCGMWLRRGDRFALTALARYATMQTRGLLRGVAERDALEVRGWLRSYAGLASGLAYGLVAPPARTGAVGERHREEKHDA